MVQVDLVKNEEQAPASAVLSQKTRVEDEQWRLVGMLAPSIVALWIAVDLLARFASPSLLHLDPWLVVAKFPPRHSPFSPNQEFYLANYVGGNVRAANLPPTEKTGPITFSTDRLGFRKTSYLPGQTNPNVLFVGGDSFTYGVGLSDDQTLPSIISTRYGLASYNGGRFHDDPDGLPELDWLLDHFHPHPATVVYTYLEHRPFDSPAEKTGLSGLLQRRAPQLEGDLRYLRLINTFFWQLSPTSVASTRFFKKLENDRFLPNDTEGAVQSLFLPDGRRMLFRDYEFKLAEQDRDAEFLSSTTRGFQWLNSEMKKRHLRLIVLLLPNRYTLYEPLLAHRNRPWAQYLNNLDARLKEAGIRTVNGLELYQKQVKSEVETGHLSFYREDAHWNPAGVERIAGPLAQAIETPLPAVGRASSNHAIQ